MTLFLVVSGYCFLESTTAVNPFKRSCYVNLQETSSNVILLEYNLDLKVI